MDNLILWKSLEISVTVYFQFHNEHVVHSTYAGRTQKKFLTFVYIFTERE